MTLQATLLIAKVDPPTPKQDHETPKEAAPIAVVEVAKVPKIEIVSVPTLHVESPPRDESYLTPEWALVGATVLLFIATYALYRATVKLSKEAKSSAEEQSQRMVRSISEAARAATAMEGVAAAMTENTRLMPSRPTTLSGSGRESHTSRTPSSRSEFLTSKYLGSWKARPGDYSAGAK
jgi:hypothetical protein